MGHASGMPSAGWSCDSALYAVAARLPGVCSGWACAPASGTDYRVRIGRFERRQDRLLAATVVWVEPAKPSEEAGRASERLVRLSGRDLAPDPHQVDAEERREGHLVDVPTAVLEVPFDLLVGHRECRLGAHLDADAVAVHADRLVNPERLFRFKALAGELEGSAVLGDGPDDVVGGPAGDLGLDFEGDGDLGSDDAGEVGDDLLGDASGVAAEAGGVEGDGAVEPPGPGGLGLGRGPAAWSPTRG